MKVRDAIKALADMPMDTELVIVIPAGHSQGQADAATFWRMDGIDPGAEPSEETEIIMGGLVKG